MAPAARRDGRRVPGAAASMGRWRSAAAGLRLLCLLWHLVSSKNVQPRCLTDFATELVCRWEVGAITNCTMEFKLLYQANFATKPQECPLENERGPGTASLCICKIPGKKFKGVTYHLALARTENSAKVWSNLSLKMESIVKPRPLINLRVEKRNDRTFILTWKRDYSPSNTLHNPAAKYEVAYWRQNHTEEKIIVPEDSSHYTIFADNLQSHSTYEASVRYGLKLWGETWSEWSATCEWVNDFESNSEKKSWKSIVWLCMMIISLILFCYICFLWMKKKWWDVIPNPRKSKMAEDIMAGKLFWVFGKMETAPCDSRRRQFPSKGGVSLPHQPLSVNQEPFLVPEEVFLSEGSLTTGRSAGDVKPGSPEEAEEEMEHIPHEDAVAGLFRDLLHGALSTGDLGVPAISPQSCAPPEKPDCLEAFSQPTYQGCQVVAEGSGLELSLSGQGPATREGQADWLPGLESSLVDPSCTALPQAEISPAAPSASGYKSFSSLEAQPGSGFSPSWSQWPSVAQEGQSQQAWGSTSPGLLPLPDTSGGFPAGQDAFSHYGAAVPETWLFPPQQRVASGASALLASGVSLPGPKAAFFSGYRAFSCALQSSLTSPELCVKPL
ncbi:interleukin-4 receptor subunit alpha [Crotalus adamanteus]|uniref:Interleukin-4 receptor subunit alpha n=1 Tax=Crotalus adamanteus TaxID=8729 RepID=A0AAW1AU37_CROAD